MVKAVRMRSQPLLQQQFEDEGEAVGVDACGDGVGGLLDRWVGVAHCHAGACPAEHLDVVAAVACRRLLRTFPVAEGSPSLSG